MRIRFVFLLMAAAALSSAAEWTKSFNIPAKPELRIESNDASVQVRVGASSRIDVRIVATGWEIGPDGVRVTDRQLGGRVNLDVRLPRQSWSVGHREVRVEVMTPTETNVEVRTGDGSVSVDGLKGDFRLATGDGSITAERVDGSLNANTGDGHIVARGRFDALRVRTGDGAVEVEARSGSKVTAPWSIETGDGRVDLRIPSDLVADLDVHTGDGDIASDLKVETSGPASKTTLRGRLNGGGLPLTVRTGDGAIHLGRL